MTLAAWRAGYEQWAVRADGDLTVYLDAALRGVAAGFSDSFLSDRSDLSQTSTSSRR